MVDRKIQGNTAYIPTTMCKAQHACAVEYCSSMIHASRDHLPPHLSATSPNYIPSSTVTVTTATQYDAEGRTTAGA